MTSNDRYRVLVIDAEEPTARLMKQWLTEAGMRVDLEELGEYGVERALAGDYDMVMAATSPPDISAHEIVRRLRGAGWRAPIAIHTVCPDPDYYAGFYALGADDIICWPYNKNRVLGQVQAHLRRWAVLGARLERAKDDTMARAIRNRDWRPGSEFLA